MNDTWRAIHVLFGKHLRNNWRLQGRHGVGVCLFDVLFMSPGEFMTAAYSLWRSRPSGAGCSGHNADARGKTVACHRKGLVLLNTRSGVHHLLFGIRKMDDDHCPTPGRMVLRQGHTCCWGMGKTGRHSISTFLYIMQSWD